MALRLFIENPPPFKKHRRRLEDGSKTTVDGSMEEGLEAIRFYLDEAKLQPTGFHHSDIDPIESKKLRGDVPLTRFETFDYACYLKQHTPDFNGLWIPHHVGVYQTPADQAPAFEELAACGIHDAVIVGVPTDEPAPGVTYKAGVGDVLSYLSEHQPDFTLGCIGIHLRPDEPERIAAKYRAAGGRLRVMGQFLDEADQAVDFIGRLGEHFKREELDLSGLEYNVGLAIFGLKNRGFYAGLLQKDGLDCEDRFAGLEKQSQRIEESVRMNLEFAERLLEAGHQHGVDIGFSIQPLIERTGKGKLHPAVHAAADLAQKLEALD